MKSFFARAQNKTIALFLILWIIVSGLAIHLRLYTLEHHASNESEDRAALIVLGNIRKTVTDAVEKNDPRLPPLAKQQAIKQQFDLILRNEGPKVRQTIERVTKELEQQAPSGSRTFYLMEADSFYYYNLTENILRTGKLSEQIRGSKYFNPLMMAPEGYWEPLNLHPFVGTVIYKVLSFFNPKISLTEGLSYTPLIITPLILLAFFFGCYVLRLPPLATALGGIYLVCVPVFLRRTMFGWYKNDPENIFFLFLIPAILFYGLKCVQKKQPSQKTAIIAGLVLSLYSLFWQGWVFLASLILVSGICIVLYSYFVQKDKRLTQNLTIFFGWMIGVMFVGVSLIFGPRDFFIVFQEGWSALQDFLNPRLALWPDLYLGVSELLPAGVLKTVIMLGGPVFVSLALAGLLLQGIQMIRKPKDARNLPSLFLLLYLIVALKLAFSAQRFSTIALIPLAYLFTLSLQKIYDVLKPLLDKPTKKIPILLPAASLILVIVLAVPPFLIAKKSTPQLLNKIYNATWDAALTKIKNETPKNSIINSWWPPGHFIKATAHRRVTFDGATINKPQAYWLANAYLAADERQTAGLLRMLNNSSNQSTEYLTSLGWPLSKAVPILKRIAPLTRDKARIVLKEVLQPEQIEKLLALTHAEPPPSYLLIYNEMVEGTIQFAFVGNWDFKKVETINADPELRSRIPAKKSPDYVPFLWKIAGGAPRISELLTPMARSENVLLFPENIRIDLDTLSVQLNSAKFGQGIPASLIYEKNGTVSEKKFPNANLTFSILLARKGDQYQCLLADPVIARSMILKLYFYGGKGTNLFEPFAEETDATGRTRIVVYHIRWDKF